MTSTYDTISSYGTPPSPPPLVPFGVDIKAHLDDVCMLLETPASVTLYLRYGETVEAVIPWVMSEVNNSCLRVFMNSHGVYTPLDLLRADPMRYLWDHRHLIARPEDIPESVRARYRA